MKKIIILIGFISLFSNIKAQDYSISIETAINKEILNYTQINNKQITISDVWALSLPSIDINFSKTNANGISFSTGFGTYSYEYKFDLTTHGPQLTSDNQDKRFRLYHKSYQALRLPFRLGKNFNLGNSFKLNIQLGLQFEYCLPNSSKFSLGYTEADDTFFNMNSKVYNTYDLNVLFLNRVEFSYTLKSKFYFNIFASYYSGLLENTKTDSILVIRDNYSSFTSIYTRGSYFDFGIGIGYIFNKK